jgi:hypothetical protein
MRNQLLVFFESHQMFGLIHRYLKNVDNPEFSKQIAIPLGALSPQCTKRMPATSNT